MSAEDDLKRAQDLSAGLLRDFQREKDPKAKALLQQRSIVARNAAREAAKKLAKQPY